MSSTITTMLRNSLNFPFDSDEDLIKDINKPFTYITSVPGKLIRPNLVEVLRQWIEMPEDKIQCIKEMTHLMHNCGLMLDDIQDCSDLRRGVPAAHKIYGIPRTILGVNWTQVCMYELMEHIDNFEVSKSAFDMFKHVLAGQGMELYWRDKYICPTEEEYLQAVSRKTGLGFTFIVKSMNMLALGKPIDAHRLTVALGVYFQIKDDYQNLCSKIYNDSKGFCEDITEGKFGFPIIHAVRNFPEEGEEIVDIMKMRTNDVKTKKRWLALIEECGSFEYTRNVLKAVKAVIDEEIGKFDKNPLIDDFLVIFHNL